LPKAEWSKPKKIAITTRKTTTNGQQKVLTQSAR